MTLLSYLGKYRYLALVVFLLGGFASILQSLVIQKIMAIETISDFGSLWRLLIVGLLTYLLFYGLELGANAIYLVSCKRIMLVLREKLTKTMLLSKDNMKQDEAIHFLSQDLEFFYDNYVTQVMRLPKNAMIFVIVSLYLITLNPSLSVLFILGSLLRPLPQIFLTKLSNRLGKEQSDEREQTMALLMDNVNGRTTILRHQAFSKTYTKLKKQLLCYETTRRNFYYLGNFLFFCNGLTQFLGRVVPIGIYFLFPQYFGHIPMSALIAMFIASNNLSNPLQNMMYATFSMQVAKSVKTKIYDVMAKGTNIEDTDHHVPNFQALILDGITKSYGSKQLFNDFSYQFDKGKKYLIKGASGRGKTTLLNIIMGEGLESGKVVIHTFDNQTVKASQANIGLVRQTPFLFNGSLKDNLCFNQDFPQEKMLEVLKQVHLLEELPNGLKTKISNNGDNISGGQRVRIELARFLLRQKDVLLLDEVTAALDKDNARRVREVIFSLPITIIDVAHHIDHAISYDAILEL